MKSEIDSKMLNLLAVRSFRFDR